MKKTLKLTADRTYRAAEDLAVITQAALRATDPERRLANASLAAGYIRALTNIGIEVETGEGSVVVNGVRFQCAV